MKKPADRKKKNDDDLWDRFTAGVAPLGGRHRNNAPDLESAPFEAAPRAPRNATGRATSAAPPPGLPELRHDSQPGIDKSSARKLKKGRHDIEGRIDLHGMTSAQAHRALDGFIEASHRAGKRCVLVITGKGLKPDGSVGVIRSAVPRWLNLEPNRGRLLAFHYATPRDGGEGALYVMLKRKR